MQSSALILGTSIPLTRMIVTWDSNKDNEGFDCGAESEQTVRTS